MDTFWKTSAAVLVVVVLVLAIGKQEKDIAVLLSMAACCFVGIAVIQYFEPVLAFLRELEELAQFQGGMLENLLKVVGIALVAETANLLCADGGSGSLGKMLSMMAGAVILFLSLPIFRMLLTLVQEILGQL